MVTAKRNMYMQRKKHRLIEQHRTSRNRPIQIKPFDKNVKAIQWRKDNFFPAINGIGIIGHP